MVCMRRVDSPSACSGAVRAFRLRCRAGASTRREGLSNVAACWHPGNMTTGEVVVEILSLDDVNERHRELLDDVGVSISELRDRAREYELTIDELEVLRKLERFEFLAGR